MEQKYYKATPIITLLNHLRNTYDIKAEIILNKVLEQNDILETDLSNYNFVKNIASTINSIIPHSQKIAKYATNILNYTNKIHGKISWVDSLLDRTYFIKEIINNEIQDDDASIISKIVITGGISLLSPLLISLPINSLFAYDDSGHYESPRESQWKKSIEVLSNKMQTQIQSNLEQRQNSSALDNSHHELIHNTCYNTTHDVDSILNIQALPQCSKVELLAVNDIEQSITPLGDSINEHFDY